MDTPEFSARFRREIPDGDNRERMVCQDCGFIHYDNPRIVVGAVASLDGQILLCRRAIEPRTGYWTVPGGFMENNETAEEGAIRETLEETGASIEVRDLLGIYSLPHIGQVHLVYRARMLAPHIEVGPECVEARLFDVDELPMGNLAFPTNTWALEHFLEARGKDLIAPRTSPVRF
ncbi:NUDIX hydrolase [bacterium]|nr:MAG: NUDIX hydrolase [bacterium]